MSDSTAQRHPTCTSRPHAKHYHLDMHMSSEPSQATATNIPETLKKPFQVTCRRSSWLSSQHTHDRSDRRGHLALLAIMMMVLQVLEEKT